MDTTTISLGRAPRFCVASLESAGGVGHSLVGEGEHTGLAISCLAGAGTGAEHKMKIKCLFGLSQLSCALNNSLYNNIK